MKIAVVFKFEGFDDALRSSFISSGPSATGRQGKVANKPPGWEMRTAKAGGIGDPDA